MREWQTSPLDECLETLLDYRGKSPPKSENGIPVLSAKVVKTTGLLRPIEQKIALDYYPKWMIRGLPRIGDIVMTTEAPMGEVIQLDEETVQYALGQRIICLRGKPNKLDNKFLRYLLTSPTQQAILASYATGTTVLGISQKALRSVPITYPDLLQQKRIGGLLGALDDKIELNRRMNETLEAMARAIFKDWFVDFGPTRAKMEGRAPYLVPDIWSLFPESLDANGKPKGWTGYSLDMLATQHTASVTPASSPDETFEHFSLPSYDVGQVPSQDRGGAIKSNKTLVPEGAILLSKLNPEIERVWLPQKATGKRQICSTEFLVFTPKANFAPSLLFGLFTEPSFRTMLQSMATGTSKSHQRVSPPALLGRQVLLGSNLLFSRFAEQVEPLLGRILANRAESGILASTRDLLLPKLMSGEVRVREASAAVEHRLAKAR
ncbi:restriction endonuclease subunit S [Reyranella sp.]|uniref:restriction endonuclease subunit S n=1 Tax=Reyranella sp. TaxID=1929291 RepID=UPI003BA8D578